MILGIVFVLVPCAVILGITVTVHKNIREFDESSHESFLG